MNAASGRECGNVQPRSQTGFMPQGRQCSCDGAAQICPRRPRTERFGRFISPVVGACRCALPNRASRDMAGRVDGTQALFTAMPDKGGMGESDSFIRRIVLIGVAVVALSIGGSLALTLWLTAEMDAESRAYAVLIATVIPATVAPISTALIGWMAVRNHRLLREVDRLASHDELTGLLNRRAFLSRGGERLTQARDARAVVALADLDHFKQVNDRLGHAAGDSALRHVATLLAEAAPEGSLVARLGGEEFVILFDWPGMAPMQTAMERMRDSIAATPCAVSDGVEVAITVSIGIAIAGQDDDMDQLLRRADAAMYAAKHGGRNRTQIAA